MSSPPGREQVNGKELAGVAAAAMVEPGMRLGLGSGSTVAYFLQALGRRLREGAAGGVVGVPTSIQTRDLAVELGIPLTTLPETPVLDLVVDGADEVDPQFNLIKGLGGALLREKMVAQAARRMLVIVDESKLVQGLGTRASLPVEVVPFAWESHLPFLETLGGETLLRRVATGEPFITDNGNYIVHCRFPRGIADPHELERVLAGRAGVVETGLFLGMAREVLVGGPRGVRHLVREG